MGPKTRLINKAVMVAKAVRKVIYLKILKKDMDEVSGYNR
jgi:hypothetical protein